MSDRSISENIRHLAGTHGKDPVEIADATIIAVNIVGRTCTVTLLDSAKPTTRDDIRLMSTVDDGLLIVPDIDSTVTILFSTFTDPVIICYSGVDKISFRGGIFGGLIKIEELIKKVNNIENAYNDLVAKYNAHVHPETGTTTGPTTSTESTTLSQTQREELENALVTHG